MNNQIQHHPHCSGTHKTNAFWCNEDQAMNPNTPWEEKLKETAPWLYQGAKYNIIVRFIRETLLAQREEMKKGLEDLPNHFRSGFISRDAAIAVVERV